MEEELMSTTQVRQSLAATQPVARRLRGICTALCDNVCTRDLQSVSSTDRIVRLGSGVALQKVPVSNSPVFHRVVRRLSFMSI